MGVFLACEDSEACAFFRDPDHILYVFFLIAWVLMLASAMAQQTTEAAGYECAVREWLEKRGTPLEDDEEECPLCVDGPSDVRLPCGHAYHAACVVRWLGESCHHTCPTCRQPPLDPKDYAWWLSRDARLVLGDGELWDRRGEPLRLGLV